MRKFILAAALGLGSIAATAAIPPVPAGALTACPSGSVSLGSTSQGGWTYEVCGTADGVLLVRI